MHDEDRKAGGGPGEETFADLLEGSFTEPARREPGGRVTARVISITSEWVFLDLGGKGEGGLAKKGLRDEAGQVSGRAGKHLPFRIMRFDGEGRNIVLSHRAIQEEKRQAEKESLKETLREGMRVSGTVTSIREFGVFVRVGGIEGLVPASEIGWDRGEEIAAAVSVGQEVDVAVVKLDWERARFTFSLKKTLSDPWENVEVRYPVGTLHTGKVSRLAAFGAFVTLEPGGGGVLHVSKLGGGEKSRHHGGGGG